MYVHLNSLSSLIKFNILKTIGRITPSPPQVYFLSVPSVPSWRSNNGVIVVLSVALVWMIFLCPRLIWCLVISFKMPSNEIFRKRKTMLSLIRLADYQSIERVDCLMPSLSRPVLDFFSWLTPTKKLSKIKYVIVHNVNIFNGKISLITVDNKYSTKLEILM